MEEFNAQEWYERAQADQQVPKNKIQMSNPQQGKHPISDHQPKDLMAEVDMVVTRIEAAFEDITTGYADWVNVGFAFASEFGEAGRSFFHRVSRFYNGYTRAETDKQYDQCLKAHGHGITINTFFYLAKQAGIEAKHGAWGMELGAGDVEHGVCSVPHAPCTMPSDAEDAPPEEDQPTLPDDIFEQLPDFFKRVVSRADSKEERDMLLLSSIVTVGSCLTTFSGIYDGNTVYPTLFLYIAAKASSGKGRLAMCRNLVNPVHWAKKKQSQQENQEYEILMKEYNAQKGKDLGIEKPPKPLVRMHILPANNTSAGFLQLLQDNDGQGLIIETEGDTLVKTLNNEMGDISDFLRKDFHHEVVSGYRKTDHDHTEVEQPRFNMILSSTVGQLTKLIPSTENGLSSRFLFYYMNLRPVWKDVFAQSNKKSLNLHFKELGQEFYSLYCTLREKDPMEFQLTESQRVEFNSFFAQLQDKYLVLQGLDYMAIIRRLGLIAFRMMMILTALRIPETGDFSVRQECGDEDFQTTLAIIRIMVRHASYIVSQLPAEVKIEKRENKKERFFDGLPEKFCRKEFLELAKNLGIANRTADKYIAAFCDKGLMERPQLNDYIKKQ
jgi:hypothetical protein